LKNCNLSVRQEHDFKGSTKNPKPKTPLFEDADFPAENSSIGGVTGRLSLAALLRTLVKSKAEDVLVIVVECCRDGYLYNNRNLMFWVTVSVVKNSFLLSWLNYELVSL
jgi:hypothetical protein